MLIRIPGKKWLVPGPLFSVSVAGAFSGATYALTADLKLALAAGGISTFVVFLVGAIMLVIAPNTVADLNE